MAYSQNNEEALIGQALQQAGITQGRLLDIGAYDPVALSNSRALIEAGWQAVMVEPSPQPFLKLLDAYSNNPQIRLVHAAVTVDRSGLIPWHDSRGDAVSTCVHAHADKWAAGAGVCYDDCLICAVTLEHLLEVTGPTFHFISIDVEGHSAELFRALPLDRLTDLRVICVEHDNQIEQLRTLAAGHGFSVVGSNAENLVFSKA